MKPSKSPTFKKSELLGHICFFAALGSMRSSVLWFPWVTRAPMNEGNSENIECSYFQVDFFRVLKLAITVSNDNSVISFFFANGNSRK